ncbi:MAG: sigma-70 family RNA polymerase sigma factor [Planctomycetota bacterium]
MPSVPPRKQLESLHTDAFGWALVCCERDPEAAADVLQSSYARVLSGGAAFEGRGELRAFLFGVVRRVAQEERRRRRRDGARVLEFERRGADERSIDLDGDTADALARNEERAYLRAALDRLPTRQREVLHLAFYQGMTLHEAAAVLGIRVGSARRHYERGKAALRQRCAHLSVR